MTPRCSGHGDSHIDVRQPWATDVTRRSGRRHDRRHRTRRWAGSSGHLGRTKSSGAAYSATCEAGRTDPCMVDAPPRELLRARRVCYANRNLNEVTVHVCSSCDATRALGFARGPTTLSSVTIPYNWWGVASGKWAHANTAANSLMVLSDGRARPSKRHRSTRCSAFAMADFSVSRKIPQSVIVKPASQIIGAGVLQHATRNMTCNACMTICVCMYIRMQRCVHVHMRRRPVQSTMDSTAGP